MFYFWIGWMAGLVFAAVGTFVYVWLARRREEKREGDINWCIVATRDRVWDVYNFLRQTGVPHQVDLGEWDELLRAFRSTRAWSKKIREGRRDSVPPYASRR